MAKRRKNLGGRPATGVNTAIGIRWPQPILDGIDEYGRKHLLERKNALREIVYKFLVREKLLDPEEVRERLFPPRDARPAA